MTTELRGQVLAGQIRHQAAELTRAARAGGRVPALAIVLAGDDDGAAWYSRAIAKAAVKEGIECRLVDLAADATAGQIAEAISNLAQDGNVHGIILQTPLPPRLRTDELAELIPPGKDIDGMNPVSAGRLMSGQPAFAPATAAAVLRMLKGYEVPLAGAEVVIIGRSAIVGKPVAQLLLREDATVTVCHSKTRDLAEISSRADVLVVAIGRPRFVTGGYVRSGAAVIDVGTNPGPDGSLVGDVDEFSVRGIAGGLTPVPGGIGPVTTATLLLHTAQAAQRAG